MHLLPPCFVIVLCRYCVCDNSTDLVLVRMKLDVRYVLKHALSSVSTPLVTWLLGSAAQRHQIPVAPGLTISVFAPDNWYGLSVLY